MTTLHKAKRLPSRTLCVLVSLLAGTLCAAEPKDAPATKQRANRLAKETSPYLLLHAHNPVDWHPWGPEALAKAKAEKKLIFLSIGYSSCYWCHVMERESFMDEEIAGLLNKHFIPIKVDREERPDIDEIYMTALQLYFRAVGSTQGGGWPLSMFLTPDAKPIGGGTYFPPRDRNGGDGFLTVLTRVQQFWEKDPKRAESISVLLADQGPPKQSGGGVAQALCAGRRAAGALRGVRSAPRRLRLQSGERAAAKVPGALQPGVPAGSRPPRRK
jgi:uncharacterized protein YyaL (SSP411 family)